MEADELIWEGRIGGTPLRVGVPHAGHALPYRPCAAIPSITVCTAGVMVATVDGTFREQRGQLVQIDPSLEQASANLGASAATTFRRVTLPLVRRAVLYHGLAVLHVQNITDVGHLRADDAGREIDPMLAAAGLEGRPSHEIADAYEAAFHAEAALEPFAELSLTWGSLQLPFR